jgi:hypothetical protein
LIPIFQQPNVFSRNPRGLAVMHPMQQRPIVKGENDAPKPMHRGLIESEFKQAGTTTSAEN